MRVAIVGSGPSGLFLAKNLLKSFQNEIKIDMFEKLSAPLGLLRYGVAPDHPEIKAKFLSHFDQILNDQRLNIYLDSDIGLHINSIELSKYYDAVAFCTGMSDSKRNWEHVQNCYAADEIFRWYNSSPSSFKPPTMDLKNTKKLVIVGNGNVSLDMARIFSRNSPQLLKSSFHPEVYEELSRSRIEEITIIGRRDISKASFTPAELREFESFTGHCRIISNPGLDKYENAANLTRISAKNIKILSEIERKSLKSKFEKSITFKFNSPILEVKNGEIYTKNEFDGCSDTTNFDMLIECTGFRQNQIFESLPQDPTGRFDVGFDQFIIKNNIYSCGWCRTGPKGNIADSMIEARNCAEVIVRDLQKSQGDDRSLNLATVRPHLFKNKYMHQN